MLALLVDADRQLRSQYGEFLRSASWQIDEAADGREALAKAFALSPAAIVTETSLPGLSGLDLCRIVRTDPVTAGTKVVLVTARARPADIEQARAVRADAILLKPCPPEDLGRTLADLFQLSTLSAFQTTESALEVARQVRRSRDVLAETTRAVRAAARSPEDLMSSPPASLRCLRCNGPLRYRRSFRGGVSTAPERWDYFECPAGCGEFRYRVRTRRLSRVT